LQLCVLCCLFFFQAEDGIRYWSVTGVQTCALPISAGAADRSLSAVMAPPAVSTCNLRPLRSISRTGWPSMTGKPAPWAAIAVPRSEERRVGKEGRTRGVAED